MTADPAGDGLDRDEALRQVVRLSLLDGTNSNPFQASNMGMPDRTFSRATAADVATLRDAVGRVFARLERGHRARLEDVQTARASGGLLEVVITYSNLETGERRELGVHLGNA